MSDRGHAACVVAVALFLLMCGRLHAQPSDPPADDTSSLKRLNVSIALLGLDALGVDKERVTRLEALFRIELQRLAGVPIAPRKEVERILASNRKLRRCDGSTDCLTAIGRRLGVDLVVTGNVASLGNSYVVNIKVVDVKTGKEVRRIASDPMRGGEDDLIEPVRVAAYRLLAPAELKGSILILADISGADVELDGTHVGKTPLPKPIAGLTLGQHELKVNAKGYSAFEEPVTVRFQKTSRVLVHLATPEPMNGAVFSGSKPGERRPQATPFYNKTWFYVAVGVGAVVVGGIIGYSLGSSDVIDCDSSPEMCP